MKKLLVALLFPFALQAVAPVPKPIQKDGKVQFIDGIKAVVVTDQKTDIVLHSDTLKPSINGTMRTLDDLIIERLAFHDAMRFKMVPNSDELDTYLKNIQRENNLTMDQLKMIFKQGGYTFDEGREQFAIMQAVNTVTQFKVIGQGIVVPDRKIEAYHKANPVMVEAQYTVQRAVVPFKGDKEKQKIALSTQHNSKKIKWSLPFTVASADLAQEKQFISAMKNGAISEPVVTAQGFELFKMVNNKPRHAKVLAERRDEIISILQRPLFEQGLKDYHQQLKDNAVVLYL